MTQESIERTQLDRIEGQLQHVDSQVGQVLQRVARMEERQDSQAASVDSHRLKLDHHDQRIGSLELAQAVQAKTQEASTTRSDDRSRRDPSDPSSSAVTCAGSSTAIVAC